MTKEELSLPRYNQLVYFCHSSLLITIFTATFPVFVDIRQTYIMLSQTVIKPYHMPVFIASPNRKLLFSYAINTDEHVNRQLT